MTVHKNLLRHLLMARSDWMEQRVMALAEINGYPHVSTAMNRLFAHLGGKPLGLSELARRLSVSRQAVHKLAQEAERQGLVEFVCRDRAGTGRTHRHRGVANAQAHPGHALARCRRGSG
jgi:hypothetical protein